MKFVACLSFLLLACGAAPGMDVEKNTAAPSTVTVGAPCSCSAQCQSNFCYPCASSGWCSAACSQNADCGPGSICVATANGDQCAPSCQSDKDCYAWPYSAQPYCIPYNTVDGTQGQACSNLFACFSTRF